MFALAACSVGPALAQADKFALPLDRPALGNASQADGAKILAEFRDAGIAGDYWLSFELRVMPRVGPERSVTGTLIGTRGVDGPLSRLHVAGERWLIQGGAHPAAWVASGQGVRELGKNEGGIGLANTGVTLFDLQMPFRYWTDFTYEGEAKVRGRPTHSFVLRPPAGEPVPVAGLTGVRVLIDREFQALVKAEQLGADGAVVKTVSLLDLKKVGEQWLVKAIDVRDARTRDKTRFSVTAAAVGLEWPVALFGPDGLTAPQPEVPREKIVRF